MTEMPSENLVITEETVLPGGAPEFEESAKALAELKTDPKFMVAIHERQLERLVSVVEEMAQRLLELEKKVQDVELSVRFPGADSPVPNLPRGFGKP